MAVLPSADSATEMPWLASPTAPVPTSFVPCWVQTPPLRLNTHAAPAFELSVYPPTMAVLPSADNSRDFLLTPPRRSDHANRRRSEGAQGGRMAGVVRRTRLLDRCRTCRKADRQQVSAVVC